jgi:hypothetical protein
VLFRFTAWRQYLSVHKSEYTHVLTTDLDVFFQLDPLACMPQRPMLQVTPSHSAALAPPQSSHTLSFVLQVFEENLAVRIAECNSNRQWVVNCPAVQNITGPQLFELIKFQGRLCAGTIYGDIGSMLSYLSVHVAEAEDQHCNDQGLLNMLTWGNFLVPAVKDVVVFNNFYGPVKTCDVGGYRDEMGFLLNNNGRRYCVLHQFKEDRAPKFVAQLREQLEDRQHNRTGRFRAVELVDVDDNLFPSKLHPAAALTNFPPLPSNRTGWELSPWGFSAGFGSLQRGFSDVEAIDVY